LTTFAKNRKAVASLENSPTTVVSLKNNTKIVAKL
jgi:hypothetical protein